MESFNLLLLGPPGCGKGTISKHIIKNYNIRHISTGDILREEAKKNSVIKDIVDRGEFVDDSYVFALLLKNLQTGFNYILDGYPRNLEQGRKCDFVNLVICIKLDDETCISRIVNRNEGRADDNRNTIQHRLNLYKKNTLPLVEHYRKEGLLREIDGSDTPDIVNKKVDEILRNIKTIN